jgi:hypothetical protein
MVLLLVGIARGSIGGVARRVQSRWRNTGARCKTSGVQRVAEIGASA